MHTRPKLPRISALALLAAAGVAISHGSTAASLSPAPAANPDSIISDLSPSQLSSLRLGQPTAQAYNVPGGAQNVFGSSIGALTEQLGQPAMDQFSALLEQPQTKSVAQWGPDTVYAFSQTGDNVFVLDSQTHGPLLLWLQGNRLEHTLSTLHELYNGANSGSLP